ncbi:MAG: S1C family serine protease [Acidimicrobiales bacterium]
MNEHDEASGSDSEAEAAAANPEPAAWWGPAEEATVGQRDSGAPWPAPGGAGYAVGGGSEYETEPGRRAPSWDPVQSPGFAGSAMASTGASRKVLAAALAGGLIAVVAGVAVGHAVWQPPPENLSAGIALPGGSGGGPLPGGSGGLAPLPGNGSGPSSNGAGSPSDAASIAKMVDPALVDIDTTLSYQQEQAAGTGMVLTSNGKILTNNHVIEGATSINVTDIGNGKTYSATVVGYDRADDVAVLQLQGASGLATVHTGSSTAARKGQPVVALGNAGGLGGTPSVAGGSVTALNQSITATDSANNISEQLHGLIETNAPIQPGDSGGPLVDTNEQVLAMDTAASAGFQFQQSGVAATQGYSIPINEALGIVRQIEAGSATSAVHIGPTPFLGVQVATPGSSSSNGVGEATRPGGTGSPGRTAGAQIVSVVAGSAAAQAGLGVGDIITSFAGQPIATVGSLSTIIMSQQVGAPVAAVYSDPAGQQHTVKVTLGPGPPQ